MSLIDTILGYPIASDEAGEQRISSAAGVPTFGLDALSSAAYGPEAALTVLLPLGASGLTWIFPITVAIVVLLGIVYASYLQTIAAYPNGGGSYTVARENLGANAGLLAASDGVTDRLIPLFAVGAFLAFTLSQIRMVAHWWKSHERGALARAAVNGLGAIGTGITLAVMAVVKFVAGAWIVVGFLPSLVGPRLLVRRHYRRIEREITAPGKLKLENLQEPIVIVPILDWNSIAENAVRFAMTMSREVEALHIEAADSANSLERLWPARVEEPAREAKQALPRLTVLKSPFRFVVQPIIDHVLEVERKNPDRTIAVLLPELVEQRWYQYFLHNQRAQILAVRPLTQGTHRVVIVNVPWYLH